MHNDETVASSLHYSWPLSDNLAMYIFQEQASGRKLDRLLNRHPRFVGPSVRHAVL